MSDERAVYVTTSQRMAAQALVERAARFGRPVERSIVLIANARRASPVEAEQRVDQTA